MLRIIHAPSPVLSQQAKAVVKVNKEITQLIEEMKQTLVATRDPEGVGLAAPQVGKPLQIFVAKPTPKSAFLICINPKIISGSQEMQDLRRPKRSKRAGNKLEGCLSLPTIWGTVLRHKEIVVSYLDEKNHKHTRKFTDFLATIVQHEIDHLNGVLFPKRVLEQSGKLYKSHKNEKGEEEFEQIEI